jgi:hypothetical protein
MKVKNISAEAQVFTGFPPFEVGEEREVSDADAEYLLGSPHMDLVDQVADEAKTKTKKTFKGVEPENE